MQLQSTVENFRQHMLHQDTSFIAPSMNELKNGVICALFRKVKQFRIIAKLNYVTESLLTVYFSMCCYRRLH